MGFYFERAAEGGAGDPHDEDHPPLPSIEQTLYGRRGKTFFVSIDFARESGSLIVEVKEDGEGPVEVVRDDNATVIVTLIGGEVADVQILFGKEAAERLAELLAEKGKS